MAKDPVCGMEVDESTARHTAQYAGRPITFARPGARRPSRPTRNSTSGPGTHPRWVATPSEPPAMRGTCYLRAVVKRPEALLTP